MISLVGRMRGAVGRGFLELYECLSKKEIEVNITNVQRLDCREMKCIHAGHDHMIMNPY